MAGESPLTWREWYRDVYLHSEHWISVRDRAVNQAGHKCQLCGASAVPLDVHHNSYDRLGEEADHDLIALCRECHELFHASRTAAHVAQDEAKRQERYESERKERHAEIAADRSVIALRALSYLARYPAGVRYKDWVDAVLPYVEWEQSDGTTARSQAERNLLNCMVMGNTHYVIGVGDFVETVEKLAVYRAGRKLNVFRLTAKGRAMLDMREVW